MSLISTALKYLTLVLLAYYVGAAPIMRRSAPEKVMQPKEHHGVTDKKAARTHEKEALSIDAHASSVPCSAYTTESTCPASECQWWEKDLVCRKVFKDLVWGGHESVDTTDTGARYRPEYVITEHKPQGGNWAACMGSGNCFQPTSVETSEVSDVWRQIMRGDLTDTAYEGVAMEVMFKCDGPSAIDIKVKCTKNGFTEPQNAQMRVWYNLVDVTPTYGSCSDPVGGGKFLPVVLPDGNQKMLRIPIDSSDAHPILRIEMIRDSHATLAASIEFTVHADKVKVKFDQCMDTKHKHGQCLETLSGTEQPTVEMRSNQTLQYQCLTAAEGSQAIAQIMKCEEWRQCLKEGEEPDPDDPDELRCENDPDEVCVKDFLIKLLKASTGVAGSSYAHTQSPTCTAPATLDPTSDKCCIDDPQHGTCISPVTLDIEALDCNCYEELKGSSEDELKGMVCNDPAVCCDWKHTHCQPTFMSLLEARQSASKKSNETRQQALGKYKNSLDTALGDKCVAR